MVRQKCVPSKSPCRGVQFFTSGAPALLRLGTAGFVGDGVEKFPRPAKMLEVYEYQGGENPPLYRSLSQNPGEIGAPCSICMALHQPSTGLHLG